MQQRKYRACQGLHSKSSTIRTMILVSCFKCIIPESLAAHTKHLQVKIGQHTYRGKAAALLINSTDHVHITYF